MIAVHRFRANKAIDFDGWLNARRYGVTATQVADASTKQGYEKVVAEMRSEPSSYDNAFMAFGREMEGPLSLWVKERFGILPNEWLIADRQTPWHLATPDGLSLNHRAIAEIKTTGKPWDEKRIPLRYQRQIQWQLKVTDAEYCLLVWMLRVESQGVFVPGWMEPEYTVIYANGDMQRKLSVVADKLRKEKGKADG